MTIKLIDTEIDIDSYLGLVKKPYNRGVGETQMTVQLLDTKYAEVKKVRMRFGEEIIQTLGWNKGDKICILTHPDDELSFVAVKRMPSSMGVSLCKDVNATSSHIQFTWRNKYKLKSSKPVELSYQIHKLGYLMFRLSSDNSAYQRG